ncbi:MAG: sulfatase-like hydrolase/transferase [Mariniphaga sp.]|nr:sulfatase-like hydrolase/transferase [Mariniphaga sp.]
MKIYIFLPFFLFLFFNSCEKKEVVKPNILFIFADDQTYHGINALGNNEVITPNLDKLVHSGLTFTHTYNMGAWNGAVCIASRAMLNTGRMLWRAKNIANTSYNSFKENKMFWSQIMEKAGYETYMTGKWHVNYPADSIFNFTGQIRPGMPATVEESYNRPQSDKNSTWLPWQTKWGGFWEGGKHWSEVISDETIEFLNQAKEKENPFFMYIAFNAPHDPRQSPKEFVNKYPLENISIPNSYLPEYPFKNEMGCTESLRDERLAPFPRTEYSVKVHRQEYYAIITHMDEQVGKIISHLKKTRQDKNTYIIFSADHGLSCGNHGLMGKQNMYDHSMRVPLIIAGPDIPKNEKREMQVYLQDLMATTLNIAGINKPEYVDFNSLLPMIKSKDATSNYHEIYGAYLNQQRMIRTENYKLILYPEAKKYRLYNLKNDPEELTDICDEPDKFPLIEDLAIKLKKQQILMDDTLDLTRFFPEIF